MKGQKLGARTRSEDEYENRSNKRQRTPTEYIKILMLNARGFDEVTEHDVVNQTPEIMGILETCLREEDGSRKFNIPDG